MEKKDAKLLLRLFKGASAAPGQPTRMRQLPSTTYPNHFRQADDGRTLGVFEATDAKGATRCIGLADWRWKDDFSLVVCGTDRRLLMEIRKTVGQPVTALTWTYSRSKRDQRNAERKRIFAEHFPDATAEFEFPRTLHELQSTLADLLFVAVVAERADGLIAGRLPRADDTVAFPEGRLVERRHMQRERNQKVVAHVKQQARLTKRGLSCEVCDFDFRDKYGPEGDGYIEAHHIRPLSERTENEPTSPADFALVCANCHRMLHRLRPWKSIDEVRALIAENRPRCENP